MDKTKIDLFHIKLINLTVLQLNMSYLWYYLLFNEGVASTITSSPKRDILARLKNNSQKNEISMSTIVSKMTGVLGKKRYGKWSFFVHWFFNFICRCYRWWLGYISIVHSLLTVKSNIRFACFCSALMVYWFFRDIFLEYFNLHCLIT